MPKFGLSLAAMASQVVIMALLLRHGGLPVWLFVLWSVLLILAVTLIVIGHNAGADRPR